MQQPKRRAETTTVFFFFLVMCAHSPWGRTPHHAWPYGCSTWEQGKPSGNVGGRLHCIKRMRWLLVTMGECASSVVIIPWAVMELTLPFRDKQELGLAVLIWKIV